MKVMIVGAGKLGHKLAETMVSENIDVTVIDRDINVIDRVNEHLDVLTVHGNGIDVSILKELDINFYDILVASTDSDEANTVICSLGKQLGCEKTIARIRNPEYLKQVDFIKDKMGIDHVVNPDLDTARAIEKYLLKSHSFYSEDFARGKVEMIDFNIGQLPEFINKKLMDIGEFHNILVTAISRDGHIIIPNGNTILMDKDLLYLIGNTGDIIKFFHRFKKDFRNREVERVMILGGSNISYYLAKKMEKEHIPVTIIEKNKDKCEKLSELLNDALIIHGDGTDILLLEDEKLSTMDAFIGTTGFDEANLLMGLMAKQEGVSKVISKVSRESYSKIIDRLDIDAALNPIHITISNILKIIRGGKIVSVSLLIGGNGEVTEIILDDKLQVIGKTLEDLKLPAGIIIGSIVRKGKVIIPNGKTKLLANDRIIVFTLTENLEGLKIFFKAKRGGFLSELWHRD